MQHDHGKCSVVVDIKIYKGSTIGRLVEKFWAILSSNIKKNIARDDVKDGITGIRIRQTGI